MANSLIFISPCYIILRNCAKRHLADRPLLGMFPVILWINEHVSIEEPPVVVFASYDNGDHLPLNRMTDTDENITYLQHSFVGSKYLPTAYGIWGKVMFSQVFVHREVSAQSGWGGGGLLREGEADTPPSPQMATTMVGTHPCHERIWWGFFVCWR